MFKVKMSQKVKDILFLTSKIYILHMYACKIMKIKNIYITSIWTNNCQKEEMPPIFF